MHRLIATVAAAAALASIGLAGKQGDIYGYLGQAEKPTTVFAGPNTHARKFARVREKQYLVIRPYSANWDKVLLQNGTNGFVKYEVVKHLPYAFTKNNPRTEAAISRMPIEQGDLASRAGMAGYALRFMGRVPYRWGGTDLNSGIDCSGFVQKMYGKIGVQLPRTAAEQALVGQPIYRLEDLQKGDRLYFWESKRGMIGHTGIYEGGGYFLHSSHGKGGVAVSPLTQSWRNILVAARR